MDIQSIKTRNIKTHEELEVDNVAEKNTACKKVSEDHAGKMDEDV
jgi:hypothetical protein